MIDSPLSILYVDDDADIRLIVEMSLRLDPNIELRTAESGQSALELLDRTGWRPDVIILDVMMPDMTGPDTLVALRSRAALCGVPALFLTAGGQGAEAWARDRGDVAGTIMKPFDPLTLATQIRALATPSLAAARQVAAGGGLAER